MAVTASAFSTGATPSTTVSAPAPAGIALGDLLMIWVVSQTASMTFSVTAGSGSWTAVTAATGQNCSAQLLWKNADSTDVALSAASGSYTVTASVSHSIAGIIVDAPGASFAPSAPSSSGQLLSAAGTSFTVNGVTTVSSGDTLLWFGGVRAPSTSVSSVITIPSGLPTAVAQLTTTTGTVNVGVTLGTQAQGSAGATGSTTGGLGDVTDDGGGLLVAISGPPPDTGTLPPVPPGRMSPAAWQPLMTNWASAAPQAAAQGTSTMAGAGVMSIGATQEAGAGLTGAGVLIGSVPVSAGAVLAGAGSLVALAAGTYTVKFNTPGSGTWLCPPGVSSVFITNTGGGGGGGGNAANANPAAGGGGGENAQDTCAVTPGSSYNYTVAAAGTAGTSAGTAGGAGGSSTFGPDDGSLTVTAHGGSGGAAGSSGGAGGTGGTGSANSAHFNGGHGGSSGPISDGGGSGAGSGGTSSAGNNGATGQVSGAT